MGCECHTWNVPLLCQDRTRGSECSLVSPPHLVADCLREVRIKAIASWSRHHWFRRVFYTSLQYRCTLTNSAWSLCEYRWIPSIVIRTHCGNLLCGLNSSRSRSWIHTFKTSHTSFVDKVIHTKKGTYTTPPFFNCVMNQFSSWWWSVVLALSYITICWPSWHSSSYNTQRQKNIVCMCGCVLARTSRWASRCIGYDIIYE